ncbi:unnamed protein product, partial [Meganyctiphanes norvegica]
RHSESWEREEGVHIQETLWEGHEDIQGVENLEVHHETSKGGFARKSSRNDDVHADGNNGYEDGGDEEYEGEYNKNREQPGLVDGGQDSVPGGKDGSRQVGQKRSRVRVKAREKKSVGNAADSEADDEMSPRRRKFNPVRRLSRSESNRDLTEAGRAGFGYAVAGVGTTAAVLSDLDKRIDSTGGTLRRTASDDKLNYAPHQWALSREAKTSSHKASDSSSMSTGVHNKDQENRKRKNSKTPSVNSSVKGGHKASDKTNTHDSGSQNRNINNFEAYERTDSGYIKSAESVSNIESQVMTDEMIGALLLASELREKEKWAFISSDKNIQDLQEGNQKTLSGTRYKENELTNPAHSVLTNKSVSDAKHATVSSNGVETTKQIDTLSEQTKIMSEQNNKLSVREEVNQVAVGNFIAGVVPSAAEND